MTGERDGMVTAHVQTIIQAAGHRGVSGVEIRQALKDGYSLDVTIGELYSAIGWLIHEHLITFDRDHGWRAK